MSLSPVSIVVPSPTPTLTSTSTSTSTPTPLLLYRRAAYRKYFSRNQVKYDQLRQLLQLKASAGYPTIIEAATAKIRALKEQYDILLRKQEAKVLNQANKWANGVLME